MKIMANRVIDTIQHCLRTDFRDPEELKARQVIFFPPKKTLFGKK